MENYGIETVHWYLNQYSGAVLPSHSKLKGLDILELTKAVLKLDDKKRRMLLTTARNIRDAADGTAKKEDTTVTENLVSNNLSVKQMHTSCHCLSKLLTVTEDIPEDLYGKEIADVVHNMLAETKSIKGGCHSCKHGRVVSKYRAKLYSLLKEGEHC